MRRRDVMSVCAKYPLLMTVRLGLRPFRMMMKRDVFNRLIGTAAPFQNRAGQVAEAHQGALRNRD
jgi:hypothetical protein